jgi:hypothetical protein
VTYLFFDIQGLHTPAWKFYLFVGILLALIIALVVWPIIWTVEDDEVGSRSRPDDDNENDLDRPTANCPHLEKDDTEDATQPADWS